MDRTWVFHTKCGKLGVVRKFNKKLILNIENGILSRSFEMTFGDVDTLLTEEQAEPITSNFLSILLRENDFIEEVTEIHECNYPGCYYPRIVRENINFNYVSSEFLQDIRAYANIKKSLDDLFNYIEPEEINFKAYGHKIRELLILACTEVEYLLLKMLTENGYEQKQVYKTIDYIKCKDILKLNCFEVQLNQYPKLGTFKPFKDWSADKPTQSISWYDAYNSVKHNRGDNINQANFENLLDAVAAIHIILEGQYGSNIFLKRQSLTDDNSLFITTKKPDWSLLEITAPLLLQGYQTKFKWLTTRKYFEDYP